jgi:hypothetical protein
MTRFTKNANGSYNVNGHNYDMLTGSRAQVWHGTACKTSGGLKKSDLMQNKAGRIVSKAKHNTAKKDNRLVKAGYGTKKGTFGFVKLGVSRGKSRSKSRGKSRSKSQKGGLSALKPASFAAGRGEGTSGVDLQLYATTMGGKRRRKGGTSCKQMGGLSPLSPTAYNGKGVGTSGVDLQFVAGNAG